VRLTLVDPKRVTFSGAFLTAIAAHLDSPVLLDDEAAWPALESLVEEMERRYELLESANAQDLHEYNDKVPAQARLPRRVLLLDEFADLSAGAKSKQFVALLDRLGAKARAAGIHLVLATQRPDKQSMPTRLKANLGGKIALRVANAVDSRIVLDQGGAQDLLDKGDLLADLGRGLVRAQGAML
jgi:S-DNA-T family DNA segregation ATPase FtsK/SpoIIIE